MKLIVGLGNPGIKYKNTRHNLGFMVLDLLLEDSEPLDKTFWQEDKYVKSLIKKAKIGEEEVILAKPQTFMNDSGIAVKLLAERFKILPEDIFIIHDDIDMPFGKLRVRFGGGSGGHRGVQSIIDTLLTDKFLRIRLGMGRTIEIGGEKSEKNHEAVEDYVLSNFESHEKGNVKTMLSETIKIVKLLLKEGIDRYMSKYNKK